MQLEAKKCLYDIHEAVRLLTVFTADKTFDSYAGEALLRSAVERQFEIAGEALTQWVKIDQQTAPQTTPCNAVIPG